MAYEKHTWQTNELVTAEKLNHIEQGIVGAIASSEKGANNGVAELDANGKILSSQLPSYVDDVLEYNAKASFPATGEAGKIYVDTSTNLTYRWSGTAYVEISQSLALGTTSSTAFRGDYGNAAYAHAITNKGSEFSSGLYKITTNSEGHVTAATAVEKADITGLGIPASDTDTKVTSAANHYTPSRDTNADKSASASGATAAWGIDVVKGVTVQTDGKGHVTGLTVTSGKIPANPDTNTHRPIRVNGTEILGNNTTALNLKAGSNVSLTNSSGTVTIAATDTTYSSRAAASGGTAVSLVTTGEKYIWNNKSDLTIGTTATTAAAGNHNHDSVYAKLSSPTFTGYVTLKNSAVTIGKTRNNGVTSNTSQLIGFADSAGDNFGRLYTQASTDGSICERLFVKNIKTNGTVVINNLDVGIKKDGTKYFAVGDAAAFRTAIGVEQIAYPLYNAYLGSTKSAGNTNVTVISGTTSMAAGTYIVFLKMPTIQATHSGTVNVLLGNKSFTYTVSTFDENNWSDTFIGIINGLTAGNTSWSVVINGGSGTMAVPGFNTIALNAIRLVG